jgi:hypothetical protein
MRPAPVIADELLEHWADVYLRTPELRRRGVLFESFLAFPAEVLHAVEAEGAACACAVARMVAQGAVRARLEEREFAHRGDRYVQKLAHHRHYTGPRRPARLIDMSAPTAGGRS